ncbi:MAG TPA: tetratricopeptide repeat protein [Spirochaetota bacterium]|nr:tetratricopeptide repeat protein [Spirochaetota bacterium]
MNQNIKINNELIINKKDNIIISGVFQKENSDFDIEYTKIVKNAIISFQLDSRMEVGTNEIKFYFRYRDNLNHCYFIIKGGQYIKFAIVANGKPSIQTSFLKISNHNLFNEKYYFILSIFESSTTVVIDNEIIFNIEHTPEEEGRIGISFYSEKDQSFNLSFNGFTISDDILDLEPILNIVKKSDPYFMLANDFYEQNRYDMALIYYKRGLLFGKGDHKIYNRIGNILFLIEEYKNAVFYYRLALQENSSKIDYKINLGRALIRSGEDEDGIKLLEEAINNNIEDVDMFVDYASVWIKRGLYEKALLYLSKAYEMAPDNPAVLSKMGKILIEKNWVKEPSEENFKEIKKGKEYLLKAAKIFYEKDPSSSVIILKYSLNKGYDPETLKFLAKILIENQDYKDIYEILKKGQIELIFDEDLIEMLIEAEFKLELYDYALKEFDKIANFTPKMKFLKAKTLILTNHIDEGLNLLSEIEKDFVNDDNINEFIYLRLYAASQNENKKDIKELFSKALAGKPYYDKVLEEYGKILVDEKKYNEALDIFSKISKDIISNVNENPELHFNIGLAYLGIGDYFLANKYFKIAFNIVKTPSIIYYLASSMFYLKQYTDALDFVLEYYDTLPDDGNKDNLLGNIYLALGRIGEAQKHYYKALSIDDENEEFGLNLAESFYRLNDYENAYMIVKQIVKKDKFDRAKTMYLKLKSHLFDTLSCANCTTEWDIPKNSENVKIDKEDLKDLPSYAPAGFCSKCNKIYCKECVKGLPDVDAICPICKSILTFNHNGLNIIAKNIINEKKEKKDNK